MNDIQKHRHARLRKALENYLLNEETLAMPEIVMRARVRYAFEAAVECSGPTVQQIVTKRFGEALSAVPRVSKPESNSTSEAQQLNGDSADPEFEDSFAD